ncbi:MAG: porin [Gammaproteobacteria bacterium]|uniref:Putative porin n=2 Tax=Pseudacidovorax intermedius TaxID=433924 RepID=A0A370FP54_9BURK|nr:MULTISPECIES: porin [Pseudacidovorax]MBP6895364.1 porin [Pseudacidovorax sp.]RDI27023.1 putative porin [Pseudacidovorax intermedius]
MKKSLVALAALAVAGVASAQSSVTLFGIVDASVSGVSNKSELVTNPAVLLANPFAYAFLPQSTSVSKTGLNNSANSSSRLGFRGVEDLGGGLAASFWLEGALSNDDGTASGFNFQRRSTVSLSGPFGEVRLGRDYKPTFWNLTVFDPFGTNGAGTALVQRAISGSTALPGIETSNVRANNSVGYFLPPNLGGFYGQAMYSFSEQTKYDNFLQASANNNSRGGRYWGGRFGYANGPLDVAVAYGEQINTSNFAVGTNNLSKNFNVGGSYDFGVAKLFAQYVNVKGTVDYSGGNQPLFNPDTKLDGYLLGVTVPVGAGQIKASYGHVKTKVDQSPLVYLTNPFFTYNAPKADQLALGYVHNLSKRTALYATVAYIKNKNGADYSAGSGNITAPYVATFTNAFGTGTYLPKNSVGYDFGIRHSF